MSDPQQHERERSVEEVPWGFYQLLLLLRHHAGRVLGSAAATLLIGILWLGSTVPEYQSSATLLLESPSSGGGGLTALLGGGGDGNAAEIVVMQSRAVIERTIQRAGLRAVEQAGDPDNPFPFGLLTRVEDLGLRPLPALMARLGRAGAAGGRLFARLEPPGDPVRVSFASSERIAVTHPARWSRLPVITEHDYRPGQPIQLGHQTLWLLARGNVVGGSYVIHSGTEADAIESLRTRVAIGERGRGSGAMVITVTDHDPRSAADLANAISDSYLELAHSRDDRRISHTTQFIEAQLAEQQAELEKAEAELVALQVEQPDSIDAGGAAASLIAQIRQLEGEKIRLTVMEQSFTEALQLIEEKEERALSRLDTQFLDSMSLRYINHIVDASTASLMLERSDTGQYHYLMQAKLTEIRGEAERIRMWRNALQEVIDRHATGDRTALSRLSAQGTLGMTMDPMTAVLMNELGRLQGLRDQRAGELTDAHPEVAALARSIADVELRIIDNLKSRTAGFDNSLSQYQGLIDAREQQMLAHSTSERQSIDSALLDLRQMTREHVEGRMAGIITQREAIEREIRRIEGDLATLPESARRLAGPTRRVAAHQAMVAFLTQSRHESQVNQLAMLSTAEVVDRAVPPRVRSRPRMGMSLLLLGVFGLALGIAYASMWEHYRGGLRSPQQLNMTTGLPVLGVIPDFRGVLGLGVGSTSPFGRPALFLPLRDEPDGDAAEAFRILRTHLVAATGRDPARLRTLAITSCGRGEGRTVTAIELSRAFRLTGARVLLIDADLREPAVHRYLLSPSSPGLAQVLRDEIAWRDAVLDTDEPGFDFMATGGVVRGASDLLTPRRMERILLEMHSFYDLVVFEVPPILQVADVSQIAPQLDVLLLLVRSDGPSHATVRDAARRVQNSGARVTGSVLVGTRVGTTTPLDHRHAHVH